MGAGASATAAQPQDAPPASAHAALAHVADQRAAEPLPSPADTRVAPPDASRTSPAALAPLEAPPELRTPAEPDPVEIAPKTPPKTRIEPIEAAPERKPADDDDEGVAESKPGYPEPEPAPEPAAPEPEPEPEPDRLEFTVRADSASAAVCGDSAALGRWALSDAVPLVSLGNGLWRGSVPRPAAAVAFKVVLGGRWEPGANRRAPRGCRFRYEVLTGGRAGDAAARFLTREARTLDAGGMQLPEFLERLEAITRAAPGARRADFEGVFTALAPTLSTQAAALGLTAAVGAVSPAFFSFSGYGYGHHASSGGAAREAPWCSVALAALPASPMRLQQLLPARHWVWLEDGAALAHQRDRAFAWLHAVPFLKLTGVSRRGGSADEFARVAAAVVARPDFADARDAWVAALVANAPSGRALAMSVLQLLGADNAPAVTRALARADLAGARIAQRLPAPLATPAVVEAVLCNDTVDDAAPDDVAALLQRASAPVPVDAVGAYMARRYPRRRRQRDRVDALTAAMADVEMLRAGQRPELFAVLQRTWMLAADAGAAARLGALLGAAPQSPDALRWLARAAAALVRGSGGGGVAWMQAQQHAAAPVDGTAAETLAELLDSSSLGAMLEQLPDWTAAFRWAPNVDAVAAGRRVLLRLAEQLHARTPPMRELKLALRAAPGVREAAQAAGLDLLVLDGFDAQVRTLDGLLSALHTFLRSFAHSVTDAEALAAAVQQITEDYPRLPFDEFEARLAPHREMATQLLWLHERFGAVLVGVWARVGNGVAVPLDVAVCGVLPAVQEVWQQLARGVEAGTLPVRQLRELLAGVAADEDAAAELARLAPADAAIADLAWLDAALARVPRLLALREALFAGADGADADPLCEQLRAAAEGVDWDAEALGALPTRLEPLRVLDGFAAGAVDVAAALGEAPAMVAWLLRHDSSQEFTNTLQVALPNTDDQALIEAAAGLSEIRMELHSLLYPRAPLQGGLREWLGLLGRLRVGDELAAAVRRVSAHFDALAALFRADTAESEGVRTARELRELYETAGLEVEVAAPGALSAGQGRWGERELVELRDRALMAVITDPQTAAVREAFVLLLGVLLDQKQVVAALAEAGIPVALTYEVATLARATVEDRTAALRRRLDAWRAEVASARDRLPALNFFTVAELQRLRSGLTSPGAAAAVAVAPPSAPEPEQQQGWTCGVCTLDNAAHSLACAACNTPAPAPAQAQDDDEEWVCPVCTLANEPDASACAICNSARPLATDWACGTCTMRNDGDRFECAACGADSGRARPGEPQPWTCAACATESAPLEPACAACGAECPSVFKLFASDGAGAGAGAGEEEDVVEALVGPELAADVRARWAQLSEAEREGLDGLGAALAGLLQDDDDDAEPDNTDAADDVFTVRVDGDMHIAVLSAFVSRLGRLPRRGEVLFARRGLSAEDVELLLRRFSHGRSLFVLADAHELPYRLQTRLVELLRAMPQRRASSLLIMSRAHAAAAPPMQQQFAAVHQPPLPDAELAAAVRAATGGAVSAVASAICGAGKSRFVLMAAAELEAEYVSVPVRAATTAAELRAATRPREPGRQRVVHLRLAHALPADVDTMLFERLLVLPGPPPADRWFVELPVGVPVPVARLLPTDEVAVAPETLSLQTPVRDGRRVRVEFDGAMAEVARFKQALATDGPFVVDEDGPLPTPEQCFAVLAEMCASEHAPQPSFTLFTSFARFAAAQFARMMRPDGVLANDVLAEVDEGLQGFRRAFVRLLFESARDFTARSVPQGAGGAEAGPLRWEESLHPMALMKTTGGVDVVCRRLDFLDDFFEPELRVRLADNGVDTRTDWRQMSAAELRRRGPALLRDISGAGTERDDDPDYVWTGDCLFKMVAIQLRLLYGLPVVLMGETGCGKSALVRALCRTLGIDVRVLNVDGGMDDAYIRAWVAASLRVVPAPGRQVLLFFDEVNTCNSMGLFKELVCDGSLDGVQLPAWALVAAACNPHRRRAAAGLAPDIGLVYAAEGADELAGLVYRVHALPESMLDHVFDFGSLSDEVEALYVRAILAARGVPKRFAANVCLAQAAVRRAAGGERSAVGLRDAVRFCTVYAWFREHLAIVFVEREDEACQLLALAFCFYMRLGREDRATFADDAGLGGEFGRTLEAAEQYVARMMSIPEGIALNEALVENLFMLLVSIVTFTPIILVGKPGVGKSLAVSLLAKNLTGAESPNFFLRRLPAIALRSYQCSPLSTAGGISAAFDAAASFQQHNTITVLVLDELGLAEASPHLPLKVLHRVLDEAPGRGVTVVGVSNWALDPAKMNRAVHLYRPDPTVDDLARTARDMVSNRFARAHVGVLAEAYVRVYAAQQSPSFWGLRDFFHLVRSVAASGGDVELAARRNFGGRPAAEVEAAVGAFLLASGQLDSHNSSTTEQLLRSSLAQRDARHLMVLSSAGVQLLFDRGLLDRARTAVLFGSQFPGDEACAARLQLQRLKQHMAAGDRVVLVHCEHLYEALYDVLNQRYTRVRGQSFVRLSLGEHSREFPVHDDFRVVVVVRAAEAARLAAPLLNRFEKHVFELRDVLEPRHEAARLACAALGVGDEDAAASAALAADGDAALAERLLLWCAPPNVGLAHEAYADQRGHSSLAQFWDALEHDDGDGGGFGQRIEVLTHDVAPARAGTPAPALQLHDFATERDLREAFLGTERGGVFALECDLHAVSERHVQHAKWLLDTGRDDVTVLLVVHLDRRRPPRVLLGQRWRTVYVDSMARPATELGMAGRPVGAALAAADDAAVTGMVRCCCRAASARLAFPWRRSEHEQRAQIRRALECDAGVLVPLVRRVVDELLGAAPLDVTARDLEHAGTFAAALQLRVDEAVTAALAVVLAHVDRDCGLLLAGEPEWAERCERSFRPRVCPVRAQLGDAVPEVPARGARQGFVAQSPFSWWVFRTIEALRVLCEPGDLGAPARHLDGDFAATDAYVADFAALAGLDGSAAELRELLEFGAAGDSACELHARWWARESEVRAEMALRAAVGAGSGGVLEALEPRAWVGRMREWADAVGACRAPARVVLGAALEPFALGAFVVREATLPLKMRALPVLERLLGVRRLRSVATLEALSGSLSGLELARAVECVQCLEAAPEVRLCAQCQTPLCRACLAAGAGSCVNGCDDSTVTPVDARSVQRAERAAERLRVCRERVLRHFMFDVCLSDAAADFDAELCEPLLRLVAGGQVSLSHEGKVGLLRGLLLRDAAAVAAAVEGKEYALAGAYCAAVQELRLPGEGRMFEVARLRVSLQALDVPDDLADADAFAYLAKSVVAAQGADGLRALVVERAGAPWLRAWEALDPAVAALQHESVLPGDDPLAQLPGVPEACAAVAAALRGDGMPEALADDPGALLCALWRCVARHLAVVPQVAGAEAVAAWVTQTWGQAQPRLAGLLRFFCGEMRGSRLALSPESTADDVLRLRAMVHVAAQALMAGERQMGRALRTLLLTPAELVRGDDTVALLPSMPKDSARLVRAALQDATKFYTCPNGHVYAIGDCGQAMVQSRCPDCGAAVGGGQHTLLASNREVADGAGEGDELERGYAVLDQPEVTIATEEDVGATDARLQRIYVHSVMLLGAAAGRRGWLDDVALILNRAFCGTLGARKLVSYVSRRFAEDWANLRLLTHTSEQGATALVHAALLARREADVGRGGPALWTAAEVRGWERAVSVGADGVEALREVDFSGGDGKGGTSVNMVPRDPLWLVPEPFDFDRFALTVATSEALQADCPVLAQVVREPQLLAALRFLPGALRWLGLVHARYSHRLDREAARSRVTVRDALEAAADPAWDAAFADYAAAWNAAWSFVERVGGCQEVPVEFRAQRMDRGVPLSLSLANERDEGLLCLGLVQRLVGLHNDLVGPAAAAAEVVGSMAMAPAHAVAIDVEGELVPFLARAEPKRAAVEGEAFLRERAIAGRPRVRLEVPQTRFLSEGGHHASLADRIAQLPLPAGVSATGGVLRVAEMAASFLAEGSAGDPERTLGDYARRVLLLPEVPAACEQLRLAHLDALMAELGGGGACAEYRRPLEPADALSGFPAEAAAELLPPLRRIVATMTEVGVSPDADLKHGFLAFLEVGELYVSEAPWFELFPEGLRVGMVSAVVDCLSG